MVPAPTLPPVPDPASALNALRSLGLRVSAARRLVVEALYRAEGPVTAEELATGLDGLLPQSDLGSLYRNLGTLEEAGLIARVQAADGPRLYALRSRVPAAVACCERCGSHSPLEATALARLREAVRAACGLEAAFAHHALMGVCANCVASR